MMLRATLCYDATNRWCDIWDARSRGCGGDWCRSKALAWCWEPWPSFPTAGTLQNSWAKFCWSLLILHDGAGREQVLHPHLTSLWRCAAPPGEMWSLPEFCAIPFVFRILDRVELITIIVKLRTNVSSHVGSCFICAQIKTSSCSYMRSAFDWVRWVGHRCSVCRYCSWLKRRDIFQCIFKQ